MDENAEYILATRITNRWNTKSNDATTMKMKGCVDDVDDDDEDDEKMTAMKMTRAAGM